jgi:hypothetical protein
MAKKKIAQPYEPTPHEAEIIEAHRAKVKEKKPAPTIKLVKNARGKYDVSIDHKDQSVGWRPPKSPTSETNGGKLAKHLQNGANPILPLLASDTDLQRCRRSRALGQQGQNRLPQRYR